MLSFLIVDDHQELLHMLSENVTKEFKGRVTAASSGNEAIGILKDGKNFDFIISDYNMPDGSGADLLSYTVNYTTNIYFLFFTSEVEPKASEINEFYLGVVEKPNFKKIYQLINDCLLLQPSLKSKI